jgi:hypothetical protein
LEKQGIAGISKDIQINCISNSKIIIMITKEKLIESIKAMPEERFDDIDVLLEHIVLPEKIETGLKDIENENTYTNEEMNQIIESWFKK